MSKINGGNVPNNDKEDGTWDPGNQPTPRVNHGQVVPSDLGTRRRGNGTTRTTSTHHKMESTMMITDEQQQQDDQPDGAMMMGEDFQSPAVLIVDVIGDLLATLIRHDKKPLFWVPAGVQDRTLYVLIDTGASRNLIFLPDYEALPQPPTLRPPRSLRVVAGNNLEIPVLGWITLPFSLNTRSDYHEFAVVKNLPNDMLIGGEFLRPHEFQIVYKASAPVVYGIKDGCWERSAGNNEKMKSEHVPQLQATKKRTPAK